MFFGNLPLAVIKNPKGRYQYVGSIPVELCNTHSPTIADIMAGRVYDGIVYVSQTFRSEEQAIEQARHFGICLTKHRRE